MPSRAWLPAALAATAVVLALLGGFGPVETARLDVRWHPTSVDGRPTRLVYTLLDLADRTPARMTLRIPCRPPEALPRADDDGTVLVLSTARNPRSDRVVVVERRGSWLVARQGSSEIARLPEAGGAGCVWTLAVSGRRWTVTEPSGNAYRRVQADPPLVNGFFSEVRPGGARSPAASLAAHVSQSSPSWLQLLLQLSAVLLAVAGAGLAVGRRRRARPARGPRPLPGAVDLIVVAAILTAWIVGPSLYDDGWIRVRLENYEFSGTFSNYYNVNGSPLPLGYWLEWPLHWLAGATDVVPLLRLPSVVAILAGWALARWALARCLEEPPRAAARYTLAAVYLVGSLAWLVTLRPEPFAAVLSVAALGAAISFARHPSLPPLAVGALLVAFAVALHPAGFVAAAPFVAISPLVGGWLLESRRDRGLRLGAVLLGVAAIGVVLVTLDSTFDALAGETAAFRAGVEHASNWRDEILRYYGLEFPGWHTPPRRLFVGLTLLVVLAYAVRRERRRHWSRDLPAVSVALSLAMLLVTPSKWPWHFGTIVGLTAVGAAVELDRFLGGGRPRRLRGVAAPLVAVVAVILAAAWASANPTPWTVLDLRRLERSALVGPVHLGSAKQWLAAAAVLLAAGVAWQALRRRSVVAAPWLLAAWIVPAAASTVVVPTLAESIVDAVRFPGWTLARQSVDGLAGRASCGLGDEAVVPDPTSLHPLVPLGGTPQPPSRGVWLLGSRPAVPGLRSWDTSGAARGIERLRSPWYDVPSTARVGFFLAGRIADGLTVRVDWGRRRAGRVDVVGGGRIHLRRRRVGSPLTPWRFMVDRRLPARPEGAGAVRLSYVDRDVDPAAWVGVSAPVSYESVPLASLVRRTSPTLVHPSLNLYLPCARLPRLGGGRVERPRLLVLDERHSWPLGDRRSPFGAIGDGARLTELPLDGTPARVAGVRVYAVEWSPRRGEVVVPATVRTVAG
jgi:hypothetical protein